jgi:hypothetical protein
LRLSRACGLSASIPQAIKCLVYSGCLLMPQFGLASAGSYSGHKALEYNSKYGVHFFLRLICHKSGKIVLNFDSYSLIISQFGAIFRVEQSLR